MSAVVYKNTETKLPRWDSKLHQKQQRGVAYISGSHFVHIYGRDDGFWVMSPGLIASQQVAGQLEDWVKAIYGAEEIESLQNQVGEVIEGVWRPGLYFQEEVHQAFAINEHDQREAEQALRILIEKLDDLFIYIEPSQKGLSAFGHKTRELLILACTEIENTWQHYMASTNTSPRQRDYSTNDYVKLKNVLFLEEYEVRFKSYRDVPIIRPFLGWDISSPTQSLSWYDAYNKTKHHRNAHFDKATLLKCIEAIAANLVLFCVRFSPFSLFDSGTNLSAMINQYFRISLVNPKPTTFYVPSIKLPTTYADQLVCGQAKEYIEPWVSKPLTL